MNKKNKKYDEAFPKPSVPGSGNTIPIYFSSLTKATLALSEAQADLVARGYKTIPERLDLLKIEIEQIKEDLRLGLSENPKGSVQKAPVVQEEAGSWL